MASLSLCYNHTISCLTEPTKPTSAYLTLRWICAIDLPRVKPFDSSLLDHNEQNAKSTVSLSSSAQPLPLPPPNNNTDQVGNNPAEYQSNPCPSRATRFPVCTSPQALPHPRPPHSHPRISTALLWLSVHSHRHRAAVCGCTNAN